MLPKAPKILSFLFQLLCVSTKPRSNGKSLDCLYPAETFKHIEVY